MCLGGSENHPGADRVVVAFIDDDESAGAAIFQVGIGEQRLGEIIRDAKREAMRESVPMALCVVAFGDADWRL